MPHEIIPNGCDHEQMWKRKPNRSELRESWLESFHDPSTNIKMGTSVIICQTIVIAIICGERIDRYTTQRESEEKYHMFLKEITYSINLSFRKAYFKQKFFQFY